MSKRENLLGQSFGRLTVVEDAGSRNGKAYWKCVCNCKEENPNYVFVSAKNLKNGNTKSCGCLKIDRIREAHKKSYPQWFIDELAHEEDKKKAINGELRSKDYVDFVCPVHGIYNQKVGEHISNGERKHGCFKCSSGSKYLVGQRFGELVVESKNEERDKHGKVTWHCKCDCGNYCDVVTHKLTSGKQVNCKDWTKHEKRNTNFIDLTGQVFGKYKVIERAKNNKDGEAMWLCECSCDSHTRKVVSSYVLRAGRVNFCDCDNSRKGGKLKEDLRGKKVGKLIVISQNKDYTWDCVCECGNHINVKTAKLTHNKVSMCDKCKEKQKEEQENKYIGMKFNNWTIVGKIDSRTFRCKCSCGTIKNVALKNLKSGMSKSCGKCSRSKPVEDLVGQKFNHLTVVKYAGHGRWECECDCEKPLKDKIIVTTTALKNGYVKSCGHVIYEPTHNIKFKDLVGKKFGSLTVISEADRKASEDTKWNCECNCGGTAICTSYNLISGNSTTCGECGHINHSGSQAEHEIADLFSGFEVEKARKILDGKEIDVYIPALNLGIEYNGSPFHASVNGAYNNKNYKYHQDKFILAKEKGIHLINIFDVDWLNNKDKIVDYLYSLQGKNERIYARKCDVVCIDKSIASDFVDKYHLQGAFKQNMKINYGLYYNNELVSVMSFGDRRMKLAEKDNYELHRYCVKSGITVIGGAEKLLKAFELEYKPKYLFTYSDNNYFTGDIYSRLGFDFVRITKPDYYWFKNDKRISRISCQVRELKKKYPDLYDKAIEMKASNKEDFIMTELKACKVYGCGNSVWEKKYLT